MSEPNNNNNNSRQPVTPPQKQQPNNSAPRRVPIIQPIPNSIERPANTTARNRRQS